MTEQIKLLHSKRGSLKAQITYFVKHLEKVRVLTTTQAIIDELQNRLNKLEQIWEPFNELQSDIEATSVDIESEYAQRELFQDLYFQSVTSAQQFLSAFNTNVEDTQSRNSGSAHGSAFETTTRHNIRLPTINLPTFDGNFTQWREFFDTFKAVVHTNSDISDAQKLCYLRSSLVGDASSVVRSFETSDANYSIVWELLQKRFDNKRRIVLNHSRALLELTNISKESHVSYRNLIDSVQRHVRSLEALEQPVESWDAILVPLIATKLDPVANREWEAKVNSELASRDSIPTLDELLTFLTHKHDTLEAIVASKFPVESNVGTASGKNKESRPMQKRSFVAAEASCPICKGNHKINSCGEFLKLTPESRLERVKKSNLCINCLVTGHRVANCSQANCRKCHSKHHTLLHFEQRKPDKIEEPAQTSTLTNRTDCHSEQVLLATVAIQIKDSKGKMQNGRALLDSGSQSNFISTEFCNLLGVEKIGTEVSILGLNQTTTNTKYKCYVTMHSRINKFSVQLSCLIVPQISESLPCSRIDVENLEIPKHIKLADPHFAKPGKIDLLLGAEHFWQLLCIGQIKLKNSRLIMQRTKFGWVLSGPNDKIAQIQTRCNLNIDVQDQLARFWNIEEIPSKGRLLSEEELECESHFRNTVKQNVDGHFVVSIPFKDSLDKLGDSYNIAKRRFFALERKLQRNDFEKQRYCQFMNEYIEMNHMSVVDRNIISEFSYYLPHHGVVKENSITTKLRVVFDGSSRTTSGISINDLQGVGPTIQSDLMSILLRFRQHAIVITSDIAKMYRQILIEPQQRSLQRIVWRSEPTQPLVTYQLNTVTYGTASASFLAIRCLEELAIQSRAEYPEASRIIARDFYVDDLISGADSLEDATRICTQVSTILRTGCFELRKWSSNHIHIFDSLQCSHDEFDVLEFGQNENSKTLGLTWSSHSDHLSYNIGLDNNQSLVTKRIILSVASQIFDPLGLLSACTIRAKVLLQKLWQENVSWDESVSLDLHTEWSRLRLELLSLNELRIPRHVICKNPRLVELHCFADSSEVAYGACSYIRSIDAYNNITVNLLCAKTKVAPLKSLSIPRLELCAALVAARLVNKIVLSLTLPLNIFLWTDSNVVLSWINSPPCSLKTFVANRIVEIQDNTEISQWRHVKSKDNPADLLSRSVSPAKLKSSKLWWHGPHWLGSPQVEWPNSLIQLTQDIPELKVKSKTFVVIYDFSIFIRYSSLLLLQRVTAYCLRFCNNAKVDKLHRANGILSIVELNYALNSLIKLAQLERFGEDISSLNKINKLKPSSKLINLNPFLDSHGLLRVGGRLKNSGYDFEKCHPVILPSGHNLTYLIAQREHVRLMHCGPQTILNSLRESYWPISGRCLARKVVRQCIVCFRNNPKPSQFIMGNLPKERIVPAPAFSNTGIDYAGPILIRDRRSRGFKTSKAYISLFICFVTKAIHLELVGDLTSECFLAAFRRFSSRRGKPCNVYSDNGTNFVGANNELRELGKFLLSFGSQCTESATTDSVVWHFIPAHSPHFGGLWEAGVKSVKHHLKRVVGNALLTYEELNTVLVKIEAVLNSRPLSPLSNDPNALKPLTPAHFLIGRPLTALPDPDTRQIPENRLSRFQLLQNIHQHFWARWSKEYVSEMQLRNKWKAKQPNITLDSLVLIKDDNLPPLCWRLGRITQLYPGLDGVVRVVSVKTSKGILKRAVSKICPFPSGSESNE